jgi:hypothetical protein
VSLTPPTTGSLTPPTTGQRCYWHRGGFVQSLHSWIHSVTDTSQLRTSASLKLSITCRQWDNVRLRLDPELNFSEWSSQNGPHLRFQRHRWPVVSGVIDTAHHRSEVSLKTPTTGQQYHWHRWKLKIWLESPISQQIWIFIQNSPNMCIRFPK